METGQNECPTAILIDFGVDTSTLQMPDDKARQSLKEQEHELLYLSKSIERYQTFLENPPDQDVVVGQLVSLEQDVCVATATGKNLLIKQDVDSKASSSNNLKILKCQYEVDDATENRFCFQNSGLRTPSPKTMSRINTEASRIIEQLDSTSSEASLWDEEFPTLYPEDDEYFELPNKTQVIPDFNPSLHIINVVENKFPLEHNLIAEDSSFSTECPNAIAKIHSAPAVITFRDNDNFGCTVANDFNFPEEDPTWSPFTIAEGPVDQAEDPFDAHTSDNIFDISIAESAIGTTEDSIDFLEYPIAVVDPVTPVKNCMTFAEDFIDPVEDADVENSKFPEEGSWVNEEDPGFIAESYGVNKEGSSINIESSGVNEEVICEEAEHALALLAQNHVPVHRCQSILSSAMIPKPMETFKDFVTPIKFSKHKEKENVFHESKIKTILSAKSSKISQYRFPIKSVLNESNINSNESFTSRSNIEQLSKKIATEKYYFEKKENKSMLSMSQSVETDKALKKPSLLKKPNTFQFHVVSAKKTALYKSQSMVENLNSGVAIRRSNSFKVQYSQTPRKQVSCSTDDSHSKARISLNLPKTGTELKTPLKTGFVVPKTPGLETLGLPSSFNVLCSSKFVARGSQVACPSSGSALRRLKPPAPNTPQAIAFRRPTAASTSNRSRFASRLELPSPLPKMINEKLSRKLFPDSKTPKRK